jgi:DNA-binding response OmpR family regulator
VAEDHYLLAETVCDFLHDCGLVPVGPVASAAEGCKLARGTALDGAVLDLRLTDGLSLPICQVLAARQVPFLFLTGSSNLSVIPIEFRGAPVICKPFDSDEMKAALNHILHRMITTETPPEMETSGT